MLLFYIIISVLSGVTLVVSRIINTNLGAKVGLFQSTLINYISGLVMVSLFLLIMREQLPTAENFNIPFWAFLGGAIGVLVVALSTYITPHISVFYFSILVFIGQIFVGLIIDFFLDGSLSIGKILGGALVIIGLVYNVLLDKKSEAGHDTP